MIGKRQSLVLLALLISFALIGLVFSRPGKEEEGGKPEEAEVSVRRETDAVVGLNPELFYGAVAKYPRGPEGEAAYAGGIISHHDLDSAMIARFFSELSRGRKIKTFILLGPNHDNVGLSPVISGRVRWQIPQGGVATDHALLEKLTASGLVSLDEEHLVKDNAVTALLPFIRSYFPEAKVVPLLFTSRETMPKAMLLAEKLREAEGEDTFLLASLDFSHYLDKGTAEEKDEETLGAIGKKDYDILATYGSEHVDSPWALITFLRAMELEKGEGPQVLDHLNSADLPGQDPNYTTSYFSILYGAK
jgi:AmmeMemoRadiSam system protein B